MGTQSVVYPIIRSSPDAVFSPIPLRVKQYSGPAIGSSGPFRVTLVAEGAVADENPYNLACDIVRRWPSWVEVEIVPAFKGYTKRFSLWIRYVLDIRRQILRSLAEDGRRGFKRRRTRRSERECVDVLEPVKVLSDAG